MTARVLTRELLEAWLLDPAELARAPGVRIPAGWPQFPEAFPFVLDVVTRDPGQAPWWMRAFLLPEVLVGSGGFKGPPASGVVEIGYEVAPEFRGRGFGRRAVALLLGEAFTDPSVGSVIAHTLAQENPSTAVLARHGFRRTASLTDESHSPMWQWRLQRPAR